MKKTVVNPKYNHLFTKANYIKKEKFCGEIFRKDKLLKFHAQLTYTE